MYHLPGAIKPEPPPILVTPVRALMTRTLPRRDFIKVTRSIRPGQEVKPKLCCATGRISVINLRISSSRVGSFPAWRILDIWPPAELYPARLGVFWKRDRYFAALRPGDQRTLQNLEIPPDHPGARSLARPGSGGGLSPRRPQNLTCRWFIRQLPAC